ncbi:MAG: hypothetical protein WCG05_02895 [Alphaproteobacteria bacterium]
MRKLSYILFALAFVSLISNSLGSPDTPAASTFRKTPKILLESKVGLPLIYDNGSIFGTHRFVLKNLMALRTLYNADSRETENDRAAFRSLEAKKITTTQIDALIELEQSLIEKEKQARTATPKMQIGQVTLEKDILDAAARSRVRIIGGKLLSASKPKSEQEVQGLQRKSFDKWRQIIAARKAARNTVSSQITPAMATAQGYDLASPGESSPISSAIVPFKAPVSRLSSKTCQDVLGLLRNSYATANKEQKILIISEDMERRNGVLRSAKEALEEWTTRNNKEKIARSKENIRRVESQLMCLEEELKEIRKN